VIHDAIILRLAVQRDFAVVNIAAARACNNDPIASKLTRAAAS
jgi:hypothetical protein